MSEDGKASKARKASRTAGKSTGKAAKKAPRGARKSGKPATKAARKTAPAKEKAAPAKEKVAKPKKAKKPKRRSTKQVLEEASKSGGRTNVDQAYARTRKSLIARLENWEDQRTWDEFYQTYWRLIYSVGLKAGLRSDEAFDVVQETILSIAKQSKKNLYDPEQGSFKTWLMNMTRWRINDQFRKRKKDTAMAGADWEDDRKTALIDRFEDPKGDLLERMWDVEWKKNLADAALARVKAQVSPKQYQIFDYYVVKQWEAKKVQKHLGVSMAQVYLAKHRVGAVLKRELQKLEKNAD